MRFKLRAFALVLGLCAVALSRPSHAQTYGRITSCGDARPPAGAGNGYMDTNGIICTSGSNGAVGSYPAGSVSITASSTGTTGATTATLAANTTKLTYICGFSIRANATAAATNNATVTGTVTATMNFTQWTAPLASGIGLVEETFSPCIPSSAVNTAIAVISGAPGSGGVVSVSAWGFQL